MSRWTLRARHGLEALVPVVARKLEEEMEAGNTKYRSRLFRGLELKAEERHEEGRVEGRVEGRAEVLAELRALLERRLVARFGTLPEAAARIVARADVAALARITERVATATSLEDALRDA